MHQKLGPAIAIAALLGILSGWWIGPPMQHIAWIGELFLRTLRMIIVPLVALSIAVGVGKLGDVRALGRIGRWTASYYLLTTAIAASLGIALVSFIEPGHFAGTALLKASENGGDTKISTLTDFILSFVWPNIFDAMAKTKLLPIILFFLSFGAIATTLGNRGTQLLELLETANEIIMKMVSLIMWLAPIGIFSLLASRIGQAGGGEEIEILLKKLGLFAFTVTAGLGFHAGVILPLLLRYFGKVSPYAYFLGAAEAIVTAFSTSSSAATLPVTLKCTIDNNRVKKEIADFVLPMGATVNMDGTALYEAVATIFIAQLWDIPLDFFQMLIIFLTATVASIGAAGIPEAGLVTMIVVLQTVGLPTEGIGLLLSIDWILDRFRTAANVWGDCVGAAIVAKQAPPLASQEILPTK